MRVVDRKAAVIDRKLPISSHEHFYARRMSHKVEEIGKERKP